jgi:hypothetical protein
MKHKVGFLALVMSALFYIGCEKIETGKSFDSIVSDKSRVDSNLSFSIDSVNDYRCPIDVVCIWAGDVDIHIRFYKTFGHIDTLMNLYNPERNPISIGGYSFRVNEVNPAPVSNKVIPQEDFKIKMTITKD